MTARKVREAMHGECGLLSRPRTADGALDTKEFRRAESLRAFWL